MQVTRCERRKCADNARIAGMNVAPVTGYARFTINKETSGHALDNYGDSFGALASRIGFKLHDGWIHSPAAPVGSSGVGDKPNQRSAAGSVVWLQPFQRNYPLLRI